MNALYEDCSRGVGARNHYRQRPHRSVNHAWHNKVNRKEKESQPNYRAHNIGRCFDGFMGTTKLLKEWLQRRLEDYAKHRSVCGDSLVQRDTSP